MSSDQNTPADKDVNTPDEDAADVEGHRAAIKGPVQASPAEAKD